MHSSEFKIRIEVKTLQTLLEEKGVLSQQEKCLWLLEGDVLTTYFRQQAINLITDSNNQGDITMKHNP